VVRSKWVGRVKDGNVTVKKRKGQRGEGKRRPDRRTPREGARSAGRENWADGILKKEEGDSKTLKKEESKVE